MKIRTCSTVLLACALAACAGDEAAEAPAAAEAAAPAMSADETALAAAAEYFETHYNLGHAGMVATLYADSAWYLGADGTLAEGAAAIEVFLGSRAAMSPQIEITPGEQMIFGDQAVSYGAYMVTMTPEGAESVNFGGTYMTHSRKIEGEWKVFGHLSNLSAEPFEGYTYNPPAEMPETGGTMGDFASDFALHYNLGHASMVADRFTEDAMNAMGGAPPQHGRAAISAGLAAGLEANPADLQITDIDTFELGDGWALDGGAWNATPKDGGDPVRGGGYLNLMRQAEDGSWLIHWSVVNAWPLGDM